MSKSTCGSKGAQVVLALLRHSASSMHSMHHDDDLLRSNSTLLVARLPIGFGHHRYAIYHRPEATCHSKKVSLGALLSIPQTCSSVDHL